MLSFCASKAHILAIHDPQFQGRASVRLLDFGEKAYFELVPHGKKGPPYEELFTPQEERDSSAIWQWGISDSDLVDTVQTLDFSLVYSAHGDFWPNKHFRTMGFIFERSI